MGFVPMKNIEQQAVLVLHWVRQGFVKARTAQANQIRGLLSEFGLIVPQGIGYIASSAPELIEDASNELPGSFRILIQQLLDQLKELDRKRPAIPSGKSVPDLRASCPRKKSWTHLHQQTTHPDWPRPSHL
jgi:transposase